MPGQEVNPYIAGSAVKSAEMFFGRDDVFDFIRQNLVGPHSNNPIVLYGQRRLGKTSILYQLHRHLDAEYWCVFIDLHGLDLSSMANLTRGIATVISANLRRDHQIVVEVPDRAAFAADPAAAFETMFLDHVLTVLGSNQLVLMLDEAIRLDEEVRAGRLDRGIFAYLRHLMQHSQRLNFIFSLGSGIEEMAKDYALLFSGSLYHRISFLKPQAARDLIIRPARDRYRVTDQAAGLILRITSGHPYYTQLVCHCLFDAWVQGSTDTTNTVKVSDVHRVLAEAIELGSANLTYVWQDSTPEEQVFMAGLAATMRGESSRPVTVEDVRNAWSRVDVGVPPQEITRAVRRLMAREIIARGGRWYSFTVDLQRLWIDKHRRIDWVKDELADLISEWNAAAQVSHPDGPALRPLARTDRTSDRAPTTVRPAAPDAAVSNRDSSDKPARRATSAARKPSGATPRPSGGHSLRRTVRRARPWIWLGSVTAVLMAVALIAHFTYRPARYAAQSQNPQYAAQSQNPGASGTGASRPAVSVKQLAVLSDPKGYQIQNVAFSSDEKSIAASAVIFNAGALGGGHIDLWNSSGKFKRFLNDPVGDSYPQGVAFSPTSPSSLAVAEEDGVCLWDLTTYSVQTYTDPDSETITYADVTFTRDGKAVVAGDSDGNVYLLNPVNGQWLGNNFRDSVVYARQPSVNLNQVAVSSAGTAVAVADSAGDVYVWSMSGGSLLRLTGEVTNSVDTLAFSPSGKTLAIVGNSSIQLLNLTTRKFLTPLAGLGGSPETVAFTPDGATLVVGDTDGTIHLWNLASRKDTSISTPAHGLSGLTVSPDGRTLAVFGSQSTKLYLYDVQYAP